MWGIISSCLTTIFTCTWVAIHPNIPSPEESPIEVIVRRVILMVMALIAPELVLVWAMRQWFGARRIAKVHRGKPQSEPTGREWTLTHGFFALMGGFMIVKGCHDEPVEILLPDRLLDLDEDEFPMLTAEMILDRSKRDTLSKALAILQTAWFILQFAARSHKGLQTTQLEYATLAFTVINFATYGFWWSKPTDVHF
ncbi:hypothetical protein JAAARDRAFT_126241, partial [Jaapia argillacea MUCL 33604]